MIKLLNAALLLLLFYVVSCQYKSVNEVYQKVVLRTPIWKQRFMFTTREQLISKRVFVSAKYSIASSHSRFQEESKIQIGLIMNEKYKLECGHVWKGVGSKICVQHYDITRFLKQSSISFKVVRDRLDTDDLALLGTINITVLCKFQIVGSPLIQRKKNLVSYARNSSGHEHEITERDSDVIEDDQQETVWPISSKSLKIPLSIPIEPDQRCFLDAIIRIAPRKGLQGSPLSKSIMISTNINGAQDTVSLLEFSSRATETRTLKFMDISGLLPSYRFGRHIPSQNQTVVLSLRPFVTGENMHLDRYDVSVRTTVRRVVSPLYRWRFSGISQEMVQCTLSNLKAVRPWIAEIHISSNGREISAQFVNAPGNREDSSLPSRLKSMHLGLQQAVEYAKQKLTAGVFPDMNAILVTHDEAGTFHHENSYCDEQSGLPWAPIFAQNRAFHDDNIFVLVPDFSYFTSFSNGHDHGTIDDVWFDVVENELKYMSVSPDSNYNKVEFESKLPTAVFRGKIQRRKFSSLREAITPMGGCSSQKVGNSQALLVDADSSYISRTEMCSKYQAMVTLPGNGVWSWATKFNLLCNSVSILLAPEDSGGESWETRLRLGLQPYVHYIPLTNQSGDACRDLNSIVLWIRSHQEDALRIAEQGRSLALGKLSKDAVLREFAELLLTYASLNFTTEV